MEQLDSGRRVTLGPRCLVGRATHCQLVVEHALTSAEHAVLQFRGDGWTVRDLCSRNGTQLNGAPLPAGQRVALAAGAVLTFGGDGSRWRLVDATAPLARARTEDGGAENGGAVCEEDSGLLLLPSAEAPQACVFRDDEGGWWVEQDGPAQLGKDQQLLTIAGGRWRLELPPPGASRGLPTTRQLSDQPSLLEEVTLAFSVSRDEEHVGLQLHDGDRRFDLGSRAHHYLLLTLARARLDDAAAGEEAAEQGWRYADEVARNLGVDLTQLNLHVYRARQQIAKAGVLNAGRIVERRAGSRQLRLGPGQLRVG